MPTTLLPGSEFQINVNSGGNNGISGAQDLANLAVLSDGRFVVAYQSDYFGSATDTDPIFAIFQASGATSLSYQDFQCRWPSESACGRRAPEWRIRDGLSE